MEEMIHAKIILVVVVGFGHLAVGVQSLNSLFLGGRGRYVQRFLERQTGD